MTDARDAAVGAGVRSTDWRFSTSALREEGGYLALHTNPPGGLDKYYRENVIGGFGSFVLRIDDFKDFDEAMIQKLVTEISGVPGARTHVGACCGRRS